MKKQLQFELWQDCNSKCDFCYLNWFNVDKTNEYKLQRIAHVKQVLEDNSLYDTYDTISLIGGEFFQGQLNDPRVRDAFFDLIHKLKELLDTGRINCVWIMVSLLIGKQPDLYHCLEIFGNDPRVWFNTSWDIQGRFKSEKMRLTWEDHVMNIHRFYPKVNVNVTLILTHELITAYLNSEFSFVDFRERYGVHLFLKPPAFNTTTAAVYEKRFGTVLPNQEKVMFSALIGSHFFPNRKDFLQFLAKFKNEMGGVEYENLFNINRRADDVYRTDSTGHTEALVHRGKDTKDLGDVGCDSNPKCGHSTYYQSYYDCDACMLCDKEYIGSIL